MISAKAKAAMESGDLALAQELYCDYLTTLDQGPHSIDTKNGRVLTLQKWLDFHVKKLYEVVYIYTRCPICS